MRTMLYSFNSILCGLLLVASPTASHACEQPLQPGSDCYRNAATNTAQLLHATLDLLYATEQEMRYPNMVLRHIRFTPGKADAYYYYVTRNSSGRLQENQYKVSVESTPVSEADYLPASDLNVQTFLQHIKSYPLRVTANIDYQL